MKLVWNVNEVDYNRYRKHQHEYSDEDIQNGNAEGTYIGAVRVGNLCFDILNWGNHLWFDLYVGGVDTGYGYSLKEEYKDYPYDYADSCSFKFDEIVSDVNFEEFQKLLNEYIEKQLESLQEYVTDKGAIKVNLIEKANEDLKLW